VTDTRTAEELYQEVLAVAPNVDPWGFFPESKAALDEMRRRLAEAENTKSGDCENGPE